MKTLAKIIIILAVFALVTGFMVTAVNASGTISNDRSQFDQPNGSGFRPEVFALREIVLRAAKERVALAGFLGR